jgi:hypothetical protein
VAAVRGPETLDVEPIDLARDAVPPSWRARIESGELAAPRGYRLVRGDGTAAESFLFDGDALVALELQPGGSCAHRIDAERARALDSGLAREPGDPTRWQHLLEWTELRRRAR